MSPESQGSVLEAVARADFDTAQQLIQDLTPEQVAALMTNLGIAGHLLSHVYRNSGPHLQALDTALTALEHLTDEAGQAGT